MLIRISKFSFTIAFALVLLSNLVPPAFSQASPYPNKIRGYKVERTVVEVKQTETNDGTSDAGPTHLITFGRPSVARVTPLGITFEVPLVVAPVKQKGRVDFLTFEDISIHGHSVDVQDYRHSFNLPDKAALNLRDPLRIYIYLPTAALAALGEWTNSQETWPVTGRVYVFGKFKKGMFSFKRCVPVELNVTMRNPVRSD